MKKFWLVLVLFQFTHAGSYLEALLQGIFPKFIGYDPQSSSGNPASAMSGLAKRTSAKTGIGMVFNDRFNAKGPNFPIGFMAVSGDELYATGVFTGIGKTPIAGIAKWNGHEWHGLGAGLDGASVALAFSDSLVYAGGYFQKAGGLQIPYLAQWNGSGWDTVGGKAFNRPVMALAFSGGELFVGVEGKAADSVTGIAGWNGSVWSSLGGGADSNVYCIKATDSGVYAGGNFTRIGGASASGVAEFAAGKWHPLGSGLPGKVMALEMVGRNLYAAGNFRLGADTSVCTLARWNGTEWAKVEVEPANNSSRQYAAADLAAENGNLYVRGPYWFSETSQEYRVYRWDGRQWSRMGPRLEAGMFEGAVSFASLTVYQGHPVLAGDFSKLGQAAVPGLAIWDGVAWADWPVLVGGLGMGNFVNALAVDGNKLLAAGNFPTAGGSLANGLGALQGNEWADLGYPDSLSVLGGVKAVAGSDGNIYAASLQRNMEHGQRFSLRLLRGNQWSMLGEAHGDFSIPGVLALLPRDGGVYVAGGFDSIGALPARNIAFWDGRSWHALGSGLSGICRTLEWADGFLYAGGDFDSAGGMPAHSVARWNGSSWSVLGAAGAEGVEGTISDGSVKVIRKQGSRLVVGGSFSKAGGINTRNIASWSSQGWSGNWTAYESGTVGDIAVKNDSIFFAAYTNSFRQPGEGSSGIALWNGNEWSPVESRFHQIPGDGLIRDGLVFSLAISGNELYAGGLFNMVGDIPSNYMAQWTISEGASVRPLVYKNGAHSAQTLVFGSASHVDMKRMLVENPQIRFYDIAGHFLKPSLK